VAGKIEPGEDIEGAARREILEETQIRVSRSETSLPPVYVREGGIIWEVYPFLFRVGGQEPTLNKENTGFQWIGPNEIKKDSSVVPLTYKVVDEMLKKLE
jgi:8-oxo-dGTP pyrophosphatase MutT (NUDIX family)